MGPRLHMQRVAEPQWLGIWSCDTCDDAPNPHVNRRVWFGYAVLSDHAGYGHMVYDLRTQ